MDLHYKQEAIVGGLVIAALAVLFGGLAWLSGRDLLGGDKARFGVRYENVAGLASGDPVMVSGVRVGRVAGFDLQGVGNVVVYLEVDGSMAPRVDASAEVRAIDMLGAMMVEYRPGEAEQFLAEGAIVDGRRQGALLDQVGPLADRASAVLTGAEDLVSQRTAEEVRATLVATRRAMDAISAIGTGPTVRQATRTLAALEQTAMRLDSAVASVGQLDSVTANLNLLVANLGEATVAMRRVMLAIDSGQGTAGRIVHDTTLYNEMVRLSRSMRLLLDDIRERPGRYFHISVF